MNREQLINLSMNLHKNDREQAEIIVDALIEKVAVIFNAIKEVVEKIWDYLRPLANEMVRKEKDGDLYYYYKPYYSMVRDTRRNSQVTDNKPRFLRKNIIY